MSPLKRDQIAERGARLAPIDIVLASRKKGRPSAADIVSALADICAHRPAKAAA